MRIQFINKNLACGGSINDGNAFRVVKKSGISHILNLSTVCYGIDQIETLHYMIKDDGTSRPDRHLIPCLIYSLSVLRESEENKLFVHCSAGKNRSVSICYGILRCSGYSEFEAESILEKNYIRPLLARDKNFTPPSKIRYKEDIERILKLPPYNFAFLK